MLIPAPGPSPTVRMLLNVVSCQPATGWTLCKPMQTNVLYCGDNLDILNRYLTNLAA
jgi:hypothetical protein